MTPVVGSDDGTQYHKDFTLSITKALGDQLAAALDGLDRAPLTEPNIARLKEKPGVYQLYLNGEFVYVGKADKSLPPVSATTSARSRGAATSPRTRWPSRACT